MITVGARLVEIRWHGRGGQGVVTASHLLAEASLQDGKYFQSFPEFGPERSGAPILAYTRISDQPVTTPSVISDPDIVVVLDPSLIGRVDFLAGLKPEGLLLVNISSGPREVRKALEIPPSRVARVATVNATAISQDHLGRNFPNVPTLGALVKVEPLVSLEAVERTIQSQLGGKLSAAVIQKNIHALRQGYEETAQD